MELDKEIESIWNVEVDPDFSQDVKRAIIMSHFPYSIRIHKSRHRAAYRWCLQQLGSRWNVMDNKTGTWCCFWSGNKDFEYYLFHFLREEDAVMFGLKWS
jgi:hypothetical protein